jgi:hypothetical protein
MVLKKKMKGILWRTYWSGYNHCFDLFNDVTKNRKYKEQLKLVYLVLGNNHLKQIMYNPKTEFYDGLEDKHININQGAESTLCFF